MVETTAKLPHVVRSWFRSPAAHRRFQTYLLMGCCIGWVSWILVMGEDTRVNQDVIYYAFWTMVVVNGIYTVQHKFPDRMPYSDDPHKRHRPDDDVPDKTSGNPS